MNENIVFDVSHKELQILKSLGVYITPLNSVRGDDNNLIFTEFSIDGVLNEETFQKLIKVLEG